MKFNSLIPELTVTNIEKSKEFYQNIGFEIMYERKENKFCFLQLEDNQIMIEEQNDNWNVGEMEYPFGRGINISMSVSNVEKLYEELKNKLKQEGLFNTEYKKQIPITGFIFYYILIILYFIIFKVFNYELLLNNNLIFSFIFINTISIFTPYTKGGNYLYGFTLGLICFIL